MDKRHGFDARLPRRNVLLSNEIVRIDEGAGWRDEFEICRVVQVHRMRIAASGGKRRIGAE
jgi:hypothetical protein